MAPIIKKVSLGLLLLLSSIFACPHTIYAPNDIPLLDNRFRIDPFSEEVTFILNHSQGRQLVVLVRPDGSKLYEQKHPQSVAWVAGKSQDIITIQKPMAGPWQVLAKLDGENRIKLISHVQLKTNKLPLKLYSGEYITTHASLYYDDKLMTNSAYLSDAKLSVSLIGASSKQLFLYKDDGKNYDALPFDGDLTAHLYVDLLPGRYLLNISTQNDIFIRNKNKDAVVFLSPIRYEITPLAKGSEEVIFKFTIDSDEIDPESVSIDGVVENADNKVSQQIIAHNSENAPVKNSFSFNQKIAYGAFTFSAKAFATTRNGREIELQLPKQNFELLPPFVVPEEKTEKTVIEEETIAASLWENSWVISAIVATGVIFIAFIIFLVVRRKTKNKLAENKSELSLNELSFDELQPASIDLDDHEKTTSKESTQ